MGHVAAEQESANRTLGRAQLRDLLSTRQAAAVLGIDRRTLVERALRGAIPYFELGPQKRMVFLREHLETYVALEQYRANRAVGLDPTVHP